MVLSEPPWVLSCLLISADADGLEQRECNLSSALSTISLAGLLASTGARCKVTVLILCSFEENSSAEWWS